MASRTEEGEEVIRIGRKENAEPCVSPSGGLIAQILPACNSTISLQIGNPSPVPPEFVIVFVLVPLLIVLAHLSVW